MNTCYKLYKFNNQSRMSVYNNTVVHHILLFLSILYTYFYNSALPYSNIIYMPFFLPIILFYYFYINIFKEINSSSYLVFTLL